MIDHLMDSSIGMVRFKRSFEETALEPPFPILLKIQGEPLLGDQKFEKMVRQTKTEFES